MLTEVELDAAYAWLRANPAIREVILTGGDPLMLSPRRLGAILQALAAIPHVELLRVHTRVPVADPGAGHGGARRGAHAWTCRSGSCCTRTTPAS